MKPRKYNWLLLVRETMDAAFLPQSEMADKLKVSQQSISSWLNGSRNPSVKNMPELLKLAQDSGLGISKYETNSEIDKITAYLRENKGREFIRLLELHGSMSKVGKEKLINLAERLLP